MKLFEITEELLDVEIPLLRQSRALFEIIGDPPETEMRVNKLLVK